MAIYILTDSTADFTPEEAERLAEAELVKCLEKHIAWCQNALNEVGGEPGTT